MGVMKRGYSKRGYRKLNDKLKNPDIRKGYNLLLDTLRNPEWNKNRDISEYEKKTFKIKINKRVFREVFQLCSNYTLNRYLEEVENIKPHIYRGINYKKKRKMEELTLFD